MTRRRLILLTAGAAIVLALAADLRQPPSSQVTARAAVGAIHLYQATLSPLAAGFGARCRFVPSCSHYGEEVIRRHGLLAGGWMAMRRVARCGPWTAAGTVDLPE